MLIRLRAKVIKFVYGDKDFPIIAAFACGLYPFLRYYNSNFTFVNSWSQFIFFSLIWLVLPWIGFYLIYNLTKRTKALVRYNKYVISVLNLSCFSTFLYLGTFGIEGRWLGPILLVGILGGILIYKHIKKIIVIQFVLAAMVSLQLIPDLYKHLTYSSQWLEQPDNIESIKFKKTPNIYIIQSDGYANFSDLKKANYNFDNSDFEEYLGDKKFSLYPNFRSNYYSTLSSNSSMFAMKHHFYNNTKRKLNELYNARKVIVGKNPVLSILKKNNYKTNLLLEEPYLLVNRPKLYYDYCNIDYAEISFLTQGFEFKKNIEEDLKRAIERNSATNNFYFIEKFIPGHVAHKKYLSKGKDVERKEYLEKLREANSWLKGIINFILEKDGNSLIVMVSDHGGFVGMDYTLESRIKQSDDELINTIFSSALAIRWPDEATVFDDNLNSAVNLFRILFAYLGESEVFLESLQPDKSYGVIDEGAPFGVYEYIDENGVTTFKKH